MHLWKLLHWSEEVNLPGLIGYTNRLQKYGDDMLLRMRKHLKYFDWYIDDEAYSDKDLHASRTHLGIIDQGQQPYNQDHRFYSWLEGEFYNQDELKAMHDVVAGNDNELLLNIYCKTRSFAFLRDVDGYYAAVVYDKEQSIIYLITDRYGFKPLYWGVIGDNLVWSSELKGFLGYQDFKIKIEHQAVAQFLDVGYLLENKTWFDGIELMPPAAVLAFNIPESSVKVSHYWSWNEIKPLQGHFKENDLVEELGELFRQAVQKRVKQDEKIGITLSGGLDSRAILAASPDDSKPLHAFTFGQEGCDDVTIAAKAAAIKKAAHHVLHLEAGNWLPPRIPGVWKTDGMLNILHMHGIEFGDIYKSRVDYIIHGFSGDLVLGGSYLKKPMYLDKRINPGIARDIMHTQLEPDIPSGSYEIEKIDFYFLNNRVRRFTNTGLIYLGKWTETRQPFFSNALIEKLYSLPDSLRYKSRIYNRLLLSCFPEYFADIPYQKTGLPISAAETAIRVHALKNRFLGKIKKHAQSIGFQTKDLRHFTDYAAWIRQEPAKSFLERVLSGKDALYPDFVDRSGILKRLQEHMQKKVYREHELCLALTFEIWLQQIFEGKYRDSLSQEISNYSERQILVG